MTDDKTGSVVIGFDSFDGYPTTAFIGVDEGPGGSYPSRAVNQLHTLPLGWGDPAADTVIRGRDPYGWSGECGLWTVTNEEVEALLERSRAIEAERIEAAERNRRDHEEQERQALANGMCSRCRSWCFGDCGVGGGYRRRRSW